MVMLTPSRLADHRTAAFNTFCLAVVAAGLAIVAVGAIFNTERRLGAVGVTCVLLGGAPLMMTRQRNTVRKDREAAHRRFVEMEEAERRRTKEECDREIAEYEERKRQLQDEIDGLRTELAAQQFAQAFGILNSGELDGGGVVTRLPQPSKPCPFRAPTHTVDAVTDSGGHHYPL